MTNPRPEGYSRTRLTIDGRAYIAKESGADPLMWQDGKWVESDGGVRFPHVCDKRPNLAVDKEQIPMHVASNPCEGVVMKPEELDAWHNSVAPADCDSRWRRKIVSRGDYVLLQDGQGYCFVPEFTRVRDNAASYCQAFMYYARELDKVNGTLYR